MTRDVFLCMLSSLNILIFSFIGFHYDAFKKLNGLPLSQQAPNFDAHVLTLLEKFTDHSVSASTSSQPETSYLSIPKLNVLAPIHHSSDPQNISDELTRGVLSLRYFDPEVPGQKILFGHSSDYPWIENPFGTIFTLLPRLQTGDQIMITKGTEKYLYKVKRTAITDTALSPLLKTPEQHELILSTCYPIGFFNKRFNVIATPADSAALQSL